MTDQHINVGKGITAPLLHAQHELEKWQVTTGGERATAGKWQRGADGLLSNNYAAAFLEVVTKQWRKSKTQPLNQGVLYGLMQDERQVAQVALEALVMVISSDSDGAARNTLARRIGGRAEFSLWMCHPIWQGSQLLKHIRLMNGASLEMGLIVKRLKDKGFKKAAHYKPLTAPDKVKLGTLLLELIRVSTGIIEFRLEPDHKGHKKWRVYMTEPYWNFLQNYKKNLLIMRPVMMPMLTPPQDWTDISTGGYNTIGTACSTVHWEHWPTLIRDAHPCVLGSMNYLQSIAFCRSLEQIQLQAQVWDLGHEIGKLPCRERMPRPVDQEFKQQGLGPTAFWHAHWKYKGDQRKNTQRIKFIHNLSAHAQLTKSFAGVNCAKPDERFHFVHYVDSRGRIYQRGAQLNYQASDVQRSQLLFDRAAPMRGNERAFYWAMGDAWGVAKNNYEREQFMYEKSHLILDTGRAPLDCIGWWENAKDPWRFVALCREWSRYMEDEAYETRMVFQLDQTCSGYGHVAALLRDKRLAAMTNVIDSGENCAMDLYQTIEDLTLHDELYAIASGADEKDANLAAWWITSNLVDRSLIKETCMPLIYGRSYETMLRILLMAVRDHCDNWLTQEGYRAQDLSVVLARAIHNVCKKVLPGISNLSKWLRVIGNTYIDAKIPPHWVTPNGWKVMCFARELEQHDMYLEVSGRRMRVSCSKEVNVPNKRKTGAKMCADFIHSQDAAFLQRFVWHWKTYQYPIVTVHDCVGTSLDKVDLMHAELLDQFNRFYSEDWLELTRQYAEKKTGKRIKKAPYADTLDVEQIGTNGFLFC